MCFVFIFLFFFSILSFNVTFICWLYRLKITLTALCTDRYVYVYLFILLFSLFLIWNANEDFDILFIQIPEGEKVIKGALMGSTSRLCFFFFFSVVWYAWNSQFWKSNFFLFPRPRFSPLRTFLKMGIRDMRRNRRVYDLL